MAISIFSFKEIYVYLLIVFFRINFLFPKLKEIFFKNIEDIKKIVMNLEVILKQDFYKSLVIDNVTLILNKYILKYKIK